MGKCKDCKWWECHCDKETRLHRIKSCPEEGCDRCSLNEAKCDEGTSGFCHRYPPSLSKGAYPITTWSDNYCGEFDWRWRGFSVFR